ncbi:4'-phosphopantetheinyl transferase NpgA [Aspergillus terreus]|uniref:holo-[acyl-carrier-protein] synthase n=1 Tax=Aspergillus terreus TaxID=33178 RepID=A0A5M3ZG31_ASPTE|nr:hypothetical protein ATETN484_0014018900 [Aspergillus terreus]GFF20855.1 4'-phosphopantetheinyl transferase NpgA [Aspergillus terreus]
MASTQQPTNPPLTRWYMDMRNLTNHPPLPLLDTLKPTEQEAVTRFYHQKDRQMSLASNLLKYLFVHRTCRIPWPEIIISRTPAPHKRPCFIPAADHPRAAALPTLEFNVSHQASLVALAGTSTPSPASTQQKERLLTAAPDPATTPLPSLPQVGIDITCVNERRADATPTLAALNEYVDIFAEVFSARELETIKSTAARKNDPAYGYRLFYAFWALKEAYIKMTGEALLAPWLRELEFTDVRAPEPRAERPYTGVRTWLYGKLVEDVRVEIEAFEDDYLIATAARGGKVGSAASGGGEGVDGWGALRRITIEDVAPCARGQCQCLDGC